MKSGEIKWKIEMFIKTPYKSFVSSAFNIEKIIFLFTVIQRKFDTIIDVHCEFQNWGKNAAMIWKHLTEGCSNVWKMQKNW